MCTLWIHALFIHNTIPIEIYVHIVSVFAFCFIQRHTKILFPQVYTDSEKNKLCPVLLHAVLLRCFPLEAVLWRHNTVVHDMPTSL